MRRFSWLRFSGHRGQQPPPEKHPQPRCIAVVARQFVVLCAFRHPTTQVELTNDVVVQVILDSNVCAGIKEGLDGGSRAMPSGKSERCVPANDRSVSARLPAFRKCCGRHSRGADRSGAQESEPMTSNGDDRPTWDCSAKPDHLLSTSPGILRNQLLFTIAAQAG